MRALTFVTIILTLLPGCYASKGPPPKEVVSLREEQRRSQQELERLRKEMVVLAAAVEDLRRRLKDMEIHAAGVKRQNELYGRPLEEKAFQGTTEQAAQAQVTRDDPDSLPVEELTPPEPPPKRVVLRLHGTRPRPAPAARRTRRITRFVPFKEPPRPDGAPASTRTPAEMYRAAMELFRKGEYSRAEKAFNELWMAHPRSDLADNALFWRGECFYRLQQYSAALEMYEKVINLYPDANKAPDALLKMGLTLSRLGKKSRAQKTLEELMSRYPGSEPAKKASAALKRNLL